MDNYNVGNGLGPDLNKGLNCVLFNKFPHPQLKSCGIVVRLDRRLEKVVFLLEDKTRELSGYNTLTLSGPWASRTFGILSSLLLDRGPPDRFKY